MQQLIKDKLKSMTEKKEVVIKNYPIPGRTYQHYKGGLYKFHFMATHTETGEDLVVYTSLHWGTNFCRPLTEWNAPIDGEPHKLRFLLQR